MTPLHNAFLRQIRKRVACSHQADTVNPGQFSFGVDNVSRLKFAGIDPLTDRALDPFVRRLFLLRAHHRHCCAHNRIAAAFLNLTN
jgi:hypothetical protein